MDGTFRKIPMQITKDQLLNSFEQIAVGIVSAYSALPEDEQLQIENSRDLDYWFTRACQIAVSIVQSTPKPITHSSGVLIIDAWGWIPPEIRDQMKEANHPFYQAWAEVTGN